MLVKQVEHCGVSWMDICLRSEKRTLPYISQTVRKMLEIWTDSLLLKENKFTNW